MSAEATANRDRAIQRLARELDRVDRFFNAYESTRDENPDIAEYFHHQSISHLNTARAIQRQIGRAR